MPISPIVLQRRHAELGRIRLGEKVEMSNGKSRPAKLEHFRFTSPNERHIRDLAELYGGEPRPWANGTKSEWEVYTTANAVPVVVLRGGLSQWLETWSGGGCIHRCDGFTNTLTDSPCDPDEQVQVGRSTIFPHRDAKPTTRLSVMLPELGAVGVWRLESHGWNSAAELPGVVELAMHVGDLVMAHLVLHERTSVKDGKTSKFVVPGLDLDITPGQLKGIVTGTTPAAAGPQSPVAVGDSTSAAAIGSAPAPPVDWWPVLEAATTEAECRAIWAGAGVGGQLTDDLKAAIKTRAAQIALPTTEVVDVDAAWSALVAEAGQRGLNDTQLRGRFKAAHGHGVETATVDELDALRAALDDAPVLG